MSALASSERTMAEDLRLASAWMREVRADLVASPEDPELLAVEEILAVLLERLERARLGGD
jgi:hypothetical protein